MKKILNTVALVVLALPLVAQTLNTEIEIVNPDITWPWNWDVINDADKLITVNENGTLNIKENDTWENIEIDPGSLEIEPRSVALDDDGTIWFTTTEHGLWSYNTDQEFENFNSSNSFLPVDNLRKLAIQNNVFWISTDGMGLIKHDFNTNETIHFTTDNYTDLKTDSNLDPYIDTGGNVWFSNREFLSKISPDLEWTNEDMRFHISGGRVNDVHIVSETEIWIAMTGGLVLFDGADYNVILQNQFDKYLQILKDSNGDIWLSKTSTLNGDGIVVLRDQQEYFFDMEDNSDIPSQVFEFIEQQGTIIAVGTIGNAICKMTFDFSTSVTKLSGESFKVFPNPASTNIAVDLPEEYHLSNWVLSDWQGKMVAEGSSVPNRIEVSQLSAGGYILTLKTNKGLVSKKIMIANRP